MFCFTRVVPAGWAFLQGTLGIFWCGIQIQGETEADNVQLEACSTCLPPKKEMEVISYRVKTGGRVRPKLSWPRVTYVVLLGAERGVKKGLIKELICYLRQ